MTSDSRYGIGNGRAASRLAAMPSLARAFGAVVVVAAFVAAVSAEAATYKWTDENGVVHYSDKMPPEVVNRGNVQLNKQGMAIKKTDPALTPEQRRALEAEEARRREAARLAAEQERRDRALLSSYTTEGEIELAKSRALSTIEGIVQSARTYSDDLAKRKREAEARKASHASEQVPIALERELDGINRELARQAALLEQKKREADAVVAKYDAERQRWRELIAAKGGVAPQPAQGITPTSAPPPAGPVSATTAKE